MKVKKFSALRVDDHRYTPLHTAFASGRTTQKMLPTGLCFVCVCGCVVCVYIWVYVCVEAMVNSLVIGTHSLVFCHLQH